MTDHPSYRAGVAGVASRHSELPTAFSQWIQTRTLPISVMDQGVLNLENDTDLRFEQWFPPQGGFNTAVPDAGCARLAVSSISSRRPLGLLIPALGSRRAQAQSVTLVLDRLLPRPVRQRDGTGSNTRAQRQALGPAITGAAPQNPTRRSKIHRAGGVMATDHALSSAFWACTITTRPGTSPPIARLRRRRCKDGSRSSIYQDATLSRFRRPPRAVARSTTPAARTDPRWAPAPGNQHGKAMKACCYGQNVHGRLRRERPDRTYTAGRHPAGARSRHNDARVFGGYPMSKAQTNSKRRNAMWRIFRRLSA